MSTYFIADLHFGDPNIIMTEGRPFRTTEEMDEAIIGNWNSVVTNEDEVFILGDLAYEYINRDYLATLLAKLQGKSITLIAGNHDYSLTHLYHTHGIKIIDYPIIFKNYWILSHEPMYVTERAPYANIFGHVHTNPIYNTVSKRSCCVSAERVSYTPVSFAYIKGEVVAANTQVTEAVEMGV